MKGSNGYKFKNPAGIWQHGYDSIELAKDAQKRWVPNLTTLYNMGIIENGNTMHYKGRRGASSQPIYFTLVGKTGKRLLVSLNGKTMSLEDAYQTIKNGRLKNAKITHDVMQNLYFDKFPGVTLFQLRHDIAQAGSSPSKTQISLDFNQDVAKQVDEDTEENKEHYEAIQTKTINVSLGNITSTLINLIKNTHPEDSLDISALRLSNMLQSLFSTKSVDNQANL